MLAPAADGPVGPVLQVWRAPTDNDKGFGNWLARDWHEAGLSNLVRHVDTFNVSQPGPGEARVDVVTTGTVTGGSFVQRTIWTIRGDGSLDMDSEIKPSGNLPPLPRIGVVMRVAGEFEKLCWYGRGPWENYPDRKRSADMGVWAGTATGQYVPYVKPQETGNKEDVRWLTLTDTNGTGLSGDGRREADGDVSHTFHRRRSGRGAPQLRIEAAPGGGVVAGCATIGSGQQQLRPGGAEALCRITGRHVSPAPAVPPNVPAGFRKFPFVAANRPRPSVTMTIYPLLKRPCLPLAAALMLPWFPGLAPAESNGPEISASSAARAWAEVPEILARIVPPAFPSREFDITKYGAIGDGTTDCTRAIAGAIEACNRAGGGSVIVPAGTFLTGAIHLKSNVNLHLQKDAVLLFSTDPKDFLPVVFSRDVAELMNYSPFVYAFEQTNIAVTGAGTLDGQASKSVWADWVKKSKTDTDRLTEMGDQDIPVAQRIFGEGHFIRPTFVEPVRCKNVLIEGIRVVDSPAWELHPLYCTNVTVRGVSVASHGKNNDGCDPDSCTDVVIENCSFDTGDDCISVKAGRDHDGRRVNVPCRNVVIRNCRFKDGHGGVTLGSETAGGLKNVFAENCEFDSPNLDQAMRFKTNPARGGYIKNIYIRNCRVKTARFGIYMTMRYASSGAREGDAFPTVRDIDIRNCSFDRLTRQPIVIEGWSPTAQITDVTIANCRFPADADRNTVTNAARIHIVGSQTGGAK